jgi:hypothetical protein
MGKKSKPLFLIGRKKKPMTRQVSHAQIKHASLGAAEDERYDIADFVLGQLSSDKRWYRLQIYVPSQNSNEDYRYVMYSHPESDHEPELESAEWKNESDNFSAEGFPQQKFLSYGEEVTYFLQKNFPYAGFFRQNSRAHLENKTILYNYTAVDLPRFVTFLDPTFGQDYYIEARENDDTTYKMVTQEHEASSSNLALSRAVLVEKLKAEKFEKQVEDLKSAQERTFQLLVPASNAPSSAAAQTHQQSLLRKLKDLQQREEVFLNSWVSPGSGSFKELQTGVQLLIECIQSTKKKIAALEATEMKTANALHLVDTLPRTVYTSKPTDKENAERSVNASQAIKSKKSKRSIKTERQSEIAQIPESKKVINEAPWDGRLMTHHLDLPKVDYHRYKFTKELVMGDYSSTVAQPFVRYDIPDSGLTEDQKKLSGYNYPENQTKTIVYLMYDAIRNYDFTQGPMELTGGSKRDIQVAMMVVKALQLPQRYNKSPEELIVDKRPGVPQEEETKLVKELFALLKEEKHYRADENIDPTNKKNLSEERELYNKIKRDMHEYGMMKEVLEYQSLKPKHYSFFQMRPESGGAASSESTETPQVSPPHPEHSK